MGNSFGRKKTIKIMRIDGETIKLKTPVTVGEVLKDYAGYVLLESESVKHYGIRSKPLESQQTLEPRRLYFLVELPKVRVESLPRKVRSGINMTAKDRLESLMLARRSSSDLSFMRPRRMIAEDSRDYHKGGHVVTERSGSRVTMRVPKAVLDRLMEDSKDEAEAAKKIMDLYTGKAFDIGGRGGHGDTYKGKGKEHQQRIGEVVTSLLPDLSLERGKKELDLEFNGISIILQKKSEFLPE